MTRGDAKNGKNDPDTESEETTEADSDSKKDSDKKLRAREEKKESEEEKPGIGGQDQKQILQSMADIWNEEVQIKITPDQKVILTHKRKELMVRCWLEQFNEDIQAWRYFCQIIGRSEFALDKKEGKDWTIDLTWAIHSEDRIVKIIEGGFSDGKHPARPTSVEIMQMESEERRIGPPTAEAISRMEEVLDWIFYLEDEEERRLVWLCAGRVYWKPICWRLGCGRTKAWQMWTYTLLKITKRLNTKQSVA